MLQTTGSFSIMFLLLLFALGGFLVWKFVDAFARIARSTEALVEILRQSNLKS